AKVIEAVAALPGRVLKGLSDIAAAARSREELLTLVADYAAAKQQLDLIDYGDQVALAARIARSAVAVGEMERRRFGLVVLDEYQDTGVAQRLLLAELFGGGHAVTAVGDPNQAIYGWRGASVSNILHFTDTFGAAETYSLTVSRRSDRRILEVANRLAEPLHDKYSEQVVRLAPQDDAGEGQVGLRVLPTHAEELAWLADEVIAAHEAGTPWAGVGVLTRDNAHAADVFDALPARH